MNSATLAARPVTMPGRDRSGVRTFLLGDHPCAQLLRFAAVGGSSNIAYLLCFLGCAGLGPLGANVVGSLVSTAIANELHRRLTFGAGERVGWFTAQYQGGGLALVGLLVSTAALGGLGRVAPELGEGVRAVAVLLVGAAIGGVRFLVLRALL